jgi:glycerol-3-phosphate dehydrogenase (NAD(P)+)
MTAQAGYDIGIVGAGAWGTTLSAHLARSGHRVLLWAFEPEVAGEINIKGRNSVFLPELDLAAGIEATSDISDLRHIDRLLIAIPSAYLADTLARLQSHICPGAWILSATKGFLGPDLMRPTEFLSAKLPGHPLGALSGPNLAREVARELPAISLVASDDERLIGEFQRLLSTERFRVYGSKDVAGCELGGALKNIIAIAAGVADGLDLGQNALAGLITRGLAEMMKLGSELGASERTFFGVSGMGDLICTCQSRLSRNHQVGQRIAGGETLEQIVRSMAAVAEGIDTTKHVHAYAQAHTLDLPITRAVFDVLFKQADPARALRDLMTRALKME